MNKNIIKLAMLESVTPVLEAYNREFSMQKFGNLLLVNLAKDTSSHAAVPALRNAARQYLAIRTKVSGGKEMTDEEIATKAAETKLTEDEQKILASKAEILAKLFDLLEQGDPTNHKEYMQFIVHKYAIGGRFAIVEDVLSTTRESLAKFIILKNKKKIPPATKDPATGKVHPGNDILKYESFEQFIEEMEKYELPQEVEEDRGEYSYFYKGPQVNIVHLRDAVAAKFWGMQTRWCTASGAFGGYNSHSDLYVFLPKNPKRRSNSTFPEKYQIAIHRAGAIDRNPTCMDEQDQSYSFKKLMTDRFGDLSTVLARMKPGFTRYIIVALNENIQQITSEIRAMVMEYIREKYGSESEDWYSIIEQALTIDAPFIKEYVKKNYTSESNRSNFDDELEMRYLESVIAAIFEEQFDAGEIATDITDFLRNNIIMSRKSAYEWKPVLIEYPED